jgi:hypothetical protein
MAKKKTKPRKETVPPKLPPIVTPDYYGVDRDEIVRLKGSFGLGSPPMPEDARDMADRGDPR